MRNTFGFHLATLLFVWTNVNQRFSLYFLFILFINYNTITNYIRIIYDLSNFNHVLGVVSQTKASDGNRNHDAHAKSLPHNPLHYQGTQTIVSDSNT